MKSSAYLFGLVSIYTLAIAPGCSSSTAAPATRGTAGAAGSGTAGASGSGTAGASGSGTAGASGSGTAGASGSGTAGASGSGTAGTGGGAACTAPAAALITDFSATGGLVGGAPYTGGDPDGTVAPTASTTTGALVITLNGGATTNMYPYAYIGLGLNSCTDASAFTGVTFNIGGTLSAGCTIQFSAVDREHNTVANGGTCTTGCYAGGTVFTLPATATDVPLEFSAQPAGGTDVAGAAPVDKTSLLSIQWQVNPPAAGCTGTVTIDNVMFH